jgi:diguanylate cyclase (GGDEF)-like protein/PAS domain S-box-containing protein
VSDSGDFGRGPDAPDAGSELRRHAEELLAELGDQPLVSEEDDATLHELRVHQIELEMQNEELRRAQVELDAQREKYFDLFDRAPVGYLTLSEAGVVGDANLSAKTMLGVDRELLVGQPFSAFVFPEDRDAYYLHERSIHTKAVSQEVELRLQRLGSQPEGDGADSHFWALLKSQPARIAYGGSPSTWVTFTDIEGRRYEETRLAAFAARNDVLMRTASDGIHVLDDQGNVVEANQAFCDMLGYTREEISRLNVSQWTTEWSAEELRERIHELMEHPAMFAAQLVRKDGALRDFEINCSGVTLEGRDYLYASAHDVTERKLMEAAQEETLNRLLRIADRVPGMVYEYVLHPDGSSCFPFASEAIRQIYRVTPEEVREDASAVFKTIHPHDYDGVVESIQASAKSLTPWRHEYRVEFDDGTVRTLFGDAVPQRAADGSVVWHGFISDITQRKLAEDELKRETARLAEAEAVGHVGSWRVDFASNRSDWSEEAIRILGLDPGSVEGDPMAAMRLTVHPEDRDAFARSEMRAQSLSGARLMDFRIVRPDGEVRWVSSQTEVEHDEGGTPVAVSGIVQDVTDRKRLEQQRVDDLELLANSDILTGLHNLRGFDLVAHQAIAQAQRAGRGVGLIFGDVDGLKEINDEFGHAQGDRALVDAAAILKFTLRSADAIARVGGDEFVVLAVGHNCESVVHLNDRLQEGFDFFDATKDRPYRLSMSSGTAWCERDEPCRLDDMRARADSDMYAEKLRRQAASAGSSVD